MQLALVVLPLAVVLPVLPKALGPVVQIVLPALLKLADPRWKANAAILEEVAVFASAGPPTA